MKWVFYLFMIGAFAGIVYWLGSWYRRWSRRQEAAEERFAGVMAQALKAAKTKPGEDPEALAKQKLLHEAAAKAGEAGEVVLSIQLYARLIARYPASELATQARAAVEAQKKKLATPKPPGPAAPG